jgi:hypothetical protein
MSKKMHCAAKAILLLLPFLCLCQDAHASYPMIIDMEMGYLILFIPIILLKAWVFKNYLPQVGYGKLIKTNAAANAFSTIIAVPITWWILATVEFYLLYGEFFYTSLQEEHFNLYHKLPWFLFRIIEAPWLGCLDSSWIGNEAWSVLTSPYSDVIVGSAMILLVPFFFVSVWAEGWMNKKFFKSQDPKHTQQITRTANLWAYGCYYTIASVILAYVLWKY